MMRPTSKTPSRNRTHQVSFAPSVKTNGAFGTGASGARRGPAPPTLPNPKSLLHKKKKEELTGKEIAEKIKSGRLTSLAEVLESQPRQISKVIEEKATSMLDLFLEIGQRKSTLARFDLKIMNKAGVEELFAPRCCRIKNPVTGSQSVKDTEDYKQIVSEYNDIILTYKTNARDLLLRAAKLEVSTREKLLQQQVFDTVKSIAMNLTIAEQTRSKLTNPMVIHSLPEKEIAYQAARQYILSLDTPISSTLNFESTHEMKTAFTMSIDAENVNINDFTQRSNDEDKKIHFAVKDKLSTLIPKMTFELWHKIQEEDILRKVNEAQAVFNENEKQNETNELVAEAILQEPNISKTQLETAIKNIVNKEFKTHQNKARKNSLAGSKSQESNATYNGQSSRKQQSPRNKEPTNNSSPFIKQKGNHQRIPNSRTNTQRNTQTNTSKKHQKNSMKSTHAHAPMNTQNNTPRNTQNNTARNQHVNTGRMQSQRKRNPEGSEHERQRKQRRMN